MALVTLIQHCERISMAENLSNALPDGFEALQRFVPKWVHGTEKARNQFRVAQSLEDLTEFYTVMLERMDEIAKFLKPIPLENIPRDCANLLELALMAMEVAPAVEYYDSPDVPKAVDYDRFEIYNVAPKYLVGAD